MYFDCFINIVFFVKQKTAYEMRISDWSSDACSSDLSNVQFLRTALNAQRKARGQAEVSAGEFLKIARAQADALGLHMDMMKRPVNVGFSGGEKKRNEMVQKIGRAHV